NDPRVRGAGWLARIGRIARLGRLARIGRLAWLGPGRPPAGPPDAGWRAAGPDVGAPVDPGGRHHRGVPGPGRGAAGVRPAEPVRLGARVRGPQREAAALDGWDEQPGDVRPFRAGRWVPVGGPGGPGGLCGAERPGLRSVGRRGV